MKSSTRLLTAVAAAAAALFSTQALHAESTYGYSDTGTGAVSATARVNVNVTIPKLIMLRVGSEGATVDNVNIALAPTSGSFANGDNQTFNWDGTAPVFAASTAAGLNAFAWTNAAGATLTGAVSTPDAGTTGLSAAAILVSAGATDTLQHPGANTGTFTTLPIAANTLLTGTWTYSVDAAAAAAATAGAFSQTVTYTASAL